MEFRKKLISILIRCCQSNLTILEGNYLFLVPDTLDDDSAQPCWCCRIVSIDEVTLEFKKADTQDPAFSYNITAQSVKVDWRTGS